MMILKMMTNELSTFNRSYKKIDVFSYRLVVVRHFAFSVQQRGMN